VLKKHFATFSPAAFACCLFAFILGVRWTVFHRYGMTMPEWDQWDAEGLQLLAPWYNNEHFLRALFTPHNEHRVVLTKLLNLGLTQLRRDSSAVLVSEPATLLQHRAPAPAVLHRQIT
jgi:hypothetical protein